VRNHFAEIRTALHTYMYDFEGQLPEKLSDLVPKYIPLEKLSVFYPPANVPSEFRKLPAHWDSDPSLIDRYSNCVYLGATGIVKEVIAYEREGTWNRAHTADPWEEPVVITAALGVSSHSDAFLHQTNSFAFDKMRATRVIYAEANLHAALNCYYMGYGQYPVGDNASVIKVLRGDNPSKKKYLEFYQQERNERGEYLDPWGTPYELRSNGMRVRVKSAGKNRKFDQIGVTGYDDICFSFSNGNPIGNDTPF